MTLPAHATWRNFNSCDRKMQSAQERSRQRGSAGLCLLFWGSWGQCSSTATLSEGEIERQREREPQPRGDKFIGIGTMLESGAAAPAAAAAEILWNC